MDRWHSVLQRREGGARLTPDDVIAYQENQLFLAARPMRTREPGQSRKRPLRVIARPKARHPDPIRPMLVAAAAISTATINPEPLTAAERIQYEGYQSREEANAAVFALAKDNVAIKEIVRRTGHSRGLVRQILRRQREDVFRVRESSLESTCHGSTLSGPQVIVTPPNSGGSSRPEVFAAPCGSSPSGQHADGGPTGCRYLSAQPSARTIARLMTTLSRHAIEGRNRHSRRRRGRRSRADRSARDHRSLPRHDPAQDRGQSQPLDRARSHQPRGIVRQRRRS